MPSNQERPSSFKQVIFIFYETADNYKGHVLLPEDELGKDYQQFIPAGAKITSSFTEYFHPLFFKDLYYNQQKHK